MRAVGEATRCKVKEKVKVKKSPDNNRAADDRLSRKSRKKKKKKNKERDFRSGSWDPGGGRREGRGCAARKGPPGAGPFRPPPLSFLPLPSPRRGAHTDPISRELYRQISKFQISTIPPQTIYGTDESTRKCFLLFQRPPLEPKQSFFLRKTQVILIEPFLLSKGIFLKNKFKTKL